MNTPSQEVLSWACAFGRKQAGAKASALRAEKVLEEYYARIASEPQERFKDALVNRIEACFNGHPLGVHEVCEMLPGERRKLVATGLGYLLRKNKLKRLRPGIYQRL